MRVILDLNEVVLKKFSELAKKENRSRKNFLETILIDFLQYEEMVENKPQETQGEAKKEISTNMPLKTNDTIKKPKNEISDFWKERMAKKLGFKND